MSAMQKVDKYHFRTKIRRLFEKLIRKFGLERVKSVVPEEDHKLLNHIRKEEERKKKKRMKNKSANVPSEIPTKAKFPAKKKSGKKKQQDQDLPNANEDEGSDSELFQPLKKMSNKSNVVKVREEKNRRPENFFYSAFLLQKIFQPGRCTCQRCRIYVGK